MSENMKLTIKGTKATIEIDLSKKGRPSASQKTTLIATGREKEEYKGKEITFQLNVFHK